MLPVTFVNITLRWHLNVLAFACSLAKGRGFNLLFVHILVRDLFFSVWKPIIWIEGDLETIEPAYKCNYLFRHVEKYDSAIKEN